MKSYSTDFPILNQMIRGKRLVYLDSSGSSQQPECVIEAMNYYHRHDHANVHRGVHQLSERATMAYENTRQTIQQFINAKHAHEIIFTRGTTESINLLATCYARAHFKENDEVIVSAMEHHSNIVPWQQLREHYGIILKVVPLTTTGELDIHAYEQLFSKKTKMVAITHASNVLGTINPVEKMIAIAHDKNVPVLLDGAQAFPHLAVDVQRLDCDFYTFSAHKAYGPTGVGILYGKRALLEKLPPYQSGGAMVESVSFEKTTFGQLPYRFEAGTPNIAGVVGFQASLQYLKNIGMDQVNVHEKDLLRYATEKLNQIEKIRILGSPIHKLGVISFVWNNVHAHDIGTILDHEGIAVRAGHHCAMPLMSHFKIPACVRVSFGIYNTREDVDALINGLLSVERLFK